MGEPTAGEQALAARFQVDAAKVAAARAALNAIAVLPWPEPERVSFFARLARAARADVGPVLAKKALALAPIAGFDALEPVIGLAKKRVVGLVKALAAIDLAALAPESAELAAARAEVAELRRRLAKLESGAAAAASVSFKPIEDTTSPPILPLPDDELPLPLPTENVPLGVMRLEDLASSIAEQVASVDGFLAGRVRGMRLAGVQLDLRAASAKVNQDVALDLSAPGGGSRVGLAFAPAPATAAASAGTQVVVPDVVGYTAALARRKLTAAGFAISAATVVDAHGVVAQQMPEAGKLVANGSTVRLLFK